MYQAVKKIFAFAGKHKNLLTKAMIVSFIGAIFSALQFLALMLTLDAVIAGNKDQSVIWSSLGIMLVSIIGRTICMYYSTNKETEAGYFMVSDKRIHIGDRLRYIPMGYLNKNSLGNITALITTTLGDVENTAARCLVIVIGGFLNTIALTLMLIIIDWRIGAVALAGILCYLAATEFSQHKSCKTGPKRQQAQETLVEKVLEYIQGMGVVRAYNLEKDNSQTIKQAIEGSSQKALSLEYSIVPPMALQQLTVRVFSIIISVVSLSLYFGSTLTLSRCFLMLIASFMIYKDLENAGNMSAFLQLLSGSIDKANEIDQTPVMDIDGADITPADTSITFDGVSFAYGDHKILDNVSLNIPDKTTTAIVGPSGSGKTTMCSLIARFWDIDKGSIKLGGKDIREYKLDSLMKNISMVFQNVYLFQDTIENNIKFGKPDATHEEVVAAAMSACCHDFIMSLPDGYDTVIGEGGGSLSGGEKQRLSIARAILKNAPVIILDEATANVDPENEMELQKAIDALTHDKTIIMIAHRLKTVQNADQILVLAHGHIVQKGTHQELAAQKGIYSDFLNARKEAVKWKLA